MGKFMGHMWVATCKNCNGLVASSWVELRDEKDLAKSVARWIRQGSEVNKIERYEGDPMPDWCKCE